MSGLKARLSQHKKPIVIALVVIGLVAVAAVVSSQGGGGKNSSSSKDGTPVRPLTKASKIDSDLTGAGLEKNDRDGLPSSLRSLQKKFKNISVVTYTDTKLGREHNMRYDFTLAADADGKVLGFQASFWSKSEDGKGKSPSPVEKLGYELWRELCDGNPKFEKTSHGSGVSATESLEANFEQDGRCGVWKKRYLKAGDVDSIVDDVTVYVK